MIVIAVRIELLAIVDSNKSTVAITIAALMMYLQWN